MAELAEPPDNPTPKTDTDTSALDPTPTAIETDADFEVWFNRMIDND